MVSRTKRATVASALAASRTSSSSARPASGASRWRTTIDAVVIASATHNANSPASWSRRTDSRPADAEGQPPIRGRVADGRDDERDDVRDGRRGVTAKDHVEQRVGGGAHHADRAEGDQPPDDRALERGRAGRRAWSPGRRPAQAAGKPRDRQPDDGMRRRARRDGGHQELPVDTWPRPLDRPGAVGTWSFEPSGRPKPLTRGWRVVTWGAVSASGRPRPDVPDVAASRVAAVAVPRNVAAARTANPPVAMADVTATPAVTRRRRTSPMRARRGMVPGHARSLRPLPFGSVTAGGGSGERPRPAHREARATRW